MGVPWHAGGHRRLADGHQDRAQRVDRLYRARAICRPARSTTRSRLIMLYAMCGFANFGSLGIMIAGLTVMAPERRADIISLGGKSIVSGTLATCMTGAIVGVLTLTRLLVALRALRRGCRRGVGPPRSPSSPSATAPPMAGWCRARTPIRRSCRALLRKKGYDVTRQERRHRPATPRAARCAVSTRRSTPAPTSPSSNSAPTICAGTCSPKRMRANLTEIVRALQKRRIAVLLIGARPPELRRRRRAPTASPTRNGSCRRGKYRARDHAHYNARGLFDRHRAHAAAGRGADRTRQGAPLTCTSGASRTQVAASSAPGRQPRSATPT